jgi:hypothetical protein
MTAPRFSLLLTLFAFAATFSAAAQADPYADIVQEDQPVAWWRFETVEEGVVPNSAGEGLAAEARGGVQFNQAGPRPSEYPDFSPENRAVRIPNGPNYLVVEDPGEGSPLKFTKGDSITLEAWIRIDENLQGSFPYIIGKGRTYNPGTNPNNQNYSLRLTKHGQITFFFVDAETESTGGGVGDEGHRWTSDAFVPDDGGWHHVAVTYTFGEADSLRGYIDAEQVSGKWDMGGKTDKAPIVDDDELWIGSSMKGRNTLGGLLDEVAIYRTALSPERIKKRVNVNLQELPFAIGKVPEEVPSDRVRIEITEGLGVHRKWPSRLKEPELLYETDLFALKQLPHKYDAKGLIIDRQIPSLVHLMSRITVEGGEYELVLRSLDASRLYIDGELVAETTFKNLNSSAHQPYYDLPDHGPDLLSIAAGHQEQRITVELEPGEHVFSLYRLVGNKGKGDYLGELSVGIAKKGEQFRFLAPERDLAYTDASWLTFLDENRLALREWNQRQRMAVSEQEQDYWQRRHAWAQTQAGPSVAVPEVDDSRHVRNDIDRFILAGLNEKGLEPTPLASDWTFLRRVCLDLLGTIPTPEQIDAFFNDPPETRRERLVERLLEHPGWADHWVGYWQDVLAENPGLTKPELNNSGPFRWYLYESFLDNKPFDRMVTELVMLEGSPWSGGPAGFGIATQNDVPMAAKAHSIGQAFLAVEMKCARCHDAPYHDVKQEDLFSIAAMLKRGAEKVPGSSSVPATPEELERMVVEVSLKPGSSVKPAWPFADFVSIENTDSVPVPDELLRNPNDTREQLAAMLTSPHNTRFARVIVNRMWKRYLGRGLVEPADDWEEARESYPELLDYLSRELVAHGYDLKHVARLILHSHAYQRLPVPGVTQHSTEAGDFRGPVRRKLTGEQLADSLYAAAGKSFGSEELTMDLDGKQADSRFGHLGIPQRAWEFTTVSNERDRPSLNLPVAQSVIDLMAAYGWRQNRQDPLTDREDPLTPLQPMALANGVAANRIVDFSDHSALTALALEDQPVEVFVERLVERLLTRPISSEEREMFVSLLEDGYDERIVAGPDAVPPRQIFRTGITWSSHFSKEADIEAMNREREIERGDAPSVRLDADWRARAEDVVWTLVNSPEFVFVP